MQNPCDQHTANKVFGEHQCTMQWHVDDLEISFKKKSVADTVLKQLNKHRGKIVPVSTTRGKMHNCLGMRIDFTQPEKVIITMCKHTHTHTHTHNPKRPA